MTPTLKLLDRVRVANDYNHVKKADPDPVSVDKDNKAADAVSQAADPTLFNHVIRVFIGALFQTK